MKALLAIAFLLVASAAVAGVSPTTTPTSTPSPTPVIGSQAGTPVALQRHEQRVEISNFNGFIPEYFLSGIDGISGAQKIMVVVTNYSVASPLEVQINNGPSKKLGHLLQAPFTDLKSTDVIQWAWGDDGAISIDVVFWAP